MVERRGSLAVGWWDGSIAGWWNDGVAGQWDGRIA